MTQRTALQKGQPHQRPDSKSVVQSKDDGDEKALAAARIKVLEKELADLEAMPITTDFTPAKKRLERSKLQAKIAYIKRESDPALRAADRAARTIDCQNVSFGGVRPRTTQEERLDRANNRLSTLASEREVLMQKRDWTSGRDFQRGLLRLREIDAATAEWTREKNKALGLREW